MDLLALLRLALLNGLESHPAIPLEEEDDDEEEDELDGEDWCLGDGEAEEQETAAGLGPVEEGAAMPGAWNEGGNLDGYEK